MSTRIMFGRYKGTYVEDLPDDYLDWLATIDLRYPLRGAVTEERWRRQEGQKHASHSKPVVPTLVDPEWAFEVIDAGRRALSLRYHPDLTNGDLYAIQSVNIAADWLRDHLATVFETVGVRS